ncbi:MAG: trypsin-like peptidase domain-containing protein, partial [Phycisphaerales bacterium]|nr:trypsin-like peptidase domain-containing protein [Phycisphaerales bacterium]
CAAMAVQVCTDLGDPGCPGPDSCFETHVTRGCNDPDCCDTVCNIEPFCCENYWDDVCVSLARELCELPPSQGCALIGSCYGAHGTPGCEDEACCETICALDPFCCAVEWDEQCAFKAVYICSEAGDCGQGGAPCNEVGEGPGCADPECCAIVCSIDPFCCNFIWDEFCAALADPYCYDAAVPMGSCFPSCGKQNVECLAESDPAAYANRSFVAQMEVGCTGWIIAAPNIMMTNNHCTFGLVGTEVYFNDECDACVGGSPKETEAFVITEILIASQALDYAVFRVEGDPASTYGVASIDPTQPTVGDAVYEIHHGEGLTKGVDFGNVTSIDRPGVCIPGTTIEFGVDAIATGGASGAPIFNADSHCVVGICHCGPPCSPGWGIPLSAIMAQAQSVIEGAGGVLNICAEARFLSCPGDTDGNFRVDFNDLNRVLDWWGTARPMGDVNNDQAVDFADLNEVLDNFGRNCLAATGGDDDGDDDGGVGPRPLD